MEYFVTDPCYIIEDEMWDELIGKASEKEGEAWSDCFNEIVEDYLKKQHGKAWVSDTGFGDWTNEIDGKIFFADAGMVAVVPVGNITEEQLKLGAVVEVDDHAKVILDTSNPEWTVVKIGEFESLPYDEDDDE